MISHFKSKSYFSGVLGYPRLTVVGELSSDAAILTRFLLVTFLCLPFAIWLSLALVVAWTSCEPVRLIPHYWMSRFPLVQIVDVLPSSWVPLEPWCALPQAMLYSGWLCVPGAARLVCLGAKMVDTPSKCRSLQGKHPLTGQALRQPAELPRPWAQAEAWWAESWVMLGSGYLCVPGTAHLVCLDSPMWYLLLLLCSVAWNQGSDTARSSFIV